MSVCARNPQTMMKMGRKKNTFVHYLKDKETWHLGEKEEKYFQKKITSIHATSALLLVKPVDICPSYVCESRILCIHRGNRL